MKLKKLLKNTLPPKKYINIFLLSLCSLLCALSLINKAYGQAKYAEPNTKAYVSALSDIIKKALNENLSIKSDQLNLEVAKKETLISLANFLPSIDLSANTSWTKTTNEYSTQDVEDSFNSHGYSVTLNQSIFNLTQVFSYLSSKTDQEIQALEVAQNQQQIIEEAATLYFEVLKNKAHQQASETELTSANARYKQVKRNVELGNLAGNEIYEVLAQKEQVANELRNLKKEERNLILALENLVQYPVHISYDLIPDLSFTPIDETEAQTLTQTLINNNFDIQMARQKINKNRELINSEQADFLPTLSSSIAYSYQNSNAPSSDPADFGKSHQTQYSLTLNLPLLKGGVDYHQVQKSSLQLTQSHLERQTQLNKAIETFDIYINDINNHIASLESLSLIIHSNDAAYQGMQKAYQFGTRTMTDLLTAESKLYQSIREHQDAKYNYIIDTLGLEKTLGRLNMQAIYALERLMVAKVPQDTKQKQSKLNKKTHLQQKS